jgi:4-hydroxythreonine-4-phosphate dehydrogenase
MTTKIRPIIGITMGDAAGIGPEVIAKALYSKEVYDICRPIVLGDAEVMKKALEIAKVELRVNPVDDVSKAKFEYGILDVLDFHNIKIEELEMGKVQAMAGKASLEYIQKAAELAMEGKIHAIATASINKSAIRKAGCEFPGHTEFLAHLTKAKEVTMMLVAKQLRVFHVTIHESLKHACELIKKERVLETIKLAHETLQGIGIKQPKIAVAGLNPHASDGGLFGKEEIEEIAPAIQWAKEMEINAVGPIPPDTVFLRAKEGEFDGVVAMYHDQGHIPIKLLGFMIGVNVTIGLPIIRTSVDHGTAYEIAGKGIANSRSMIETIQLATKMAEVKLTSSKSSL